MTDGHHNIKFVPNPLQRQFIESRAKADLFSSRMGEGKSAGIAWAVYYHTRWNPGARWAIIRDTWENLRATTMQTFFEWFPPGVMGQFVKTEKTFYWADGVAKGSVEFLGMDDEADATKLMSRELAGFAIDEPAPATSSMGVHESIFSLGLTRLRQANMNWYAVKLAENNPDESHWTYRRFVLEPEPGFVLWQPSVPENERNLPAGYYENMRSSLRHRPDLIRRFVEGEFGFQSMGKEVTPQWQDKYHLALGLSPLARRETILLWDFGLHPVCIITQITPMGQWLVLDACLGDGIGIEELIDNQVAPLLTMRYAKSPLLHIGDPAGNTREQSSSARTAVRLVLKKLGGRWKAGPVRTQHRIDPLQAVLTRQDVVKVDRDRATPVWHALRGGWHYHVAKTGIISTEPVKNHPHSDIGDAMGYGAAILFPLGKLRGRTAGSVKEPVTGGHFGSADRGLISSRPGVIMPSHGQVLR